MKINFLGRKISFALEGEKAILAVCVGIAFVFWFFTKMSNTYSSDRTVSVEYILPIGKTFASLPAEELTATYEGSGWDLMSDYLFGKEKIVKVDLQQEYSSTIDQTTLLSRISNLSLNKKKLKITKTIPSILRINFKNEQKKVVPIKLNADLSYAAGYFPTGKTQLKPDSVTLRGAQENLDTINYWATEKYRLEEQKDTIFAEIKLKEQLPGLIRLSETYTNLMIPVEQWTQKKVYPEVKILNSQDSLKLIPSNIEVTFSIPLSQFNIIAKEDFSLVIDLKNVTMNEEKNTLPVLIQKSPEGIRGLSISPKSVRFYQLQKIQAGTEISED